jgi:hypothetical protein
MTTETLQYQNSKSADAAERIANLERLLLKQSVRFHALSCVHGISDHSGTFLECKNDICRDHKTALVSSPAYQKFKEDVAALTQQIDGYLK